jgi:hypothetical protein
MFQCKFYIHFSLYGTVLRIWIRVILPDGKKIPAVLLPGVINFIAPSNIATKFRGRGYLLLLNCQAISS